MVPDRELIGHVKRKLAAQYGESCQLQALLIIGSLAYPEFARPDSDIDLIAVRALDEIKGDSLHLDYVGMDGVGRLVELRVFDESGLYRYVMQCEIAQLFAFVRGYRSVIANEGALRTVSLAIGRYFSEAALMWGEMRDIGLEEHLSRMQFLMTDYRGQLRSVSLVRDPLLRLLRMSEVIRDFTSQMWMALLMRNYCDTELGRRSSVDSESPLLREVGLLRVFMAVRGGRMVNDEKYPKSEETAALIDEVRSWLKLEPAAIVDGMGRTFQRHFGRQLYLY